MVDLDQYRREIKDSFNYDLIGPDRVTTPVFPEQDVRVWANSAYEDRAAGRPFG